MLITTADVARAPLIFIAKTQIRLCLYLRNINKGCRAGGRPAMCRTSLARRAPQECMAAPTRIEKPTNITAVLSSKTGRTQNTLMTDGVSI